MPGKRAMCKFFDKASGCDKGERCAFAHSPAELAQNVVAPVGLIDGMGLMAPHAAVPLSQAGPLAQPGYSYP